MDPGKEKGAFEGGDKLHVVGPVGLTEEVTLESA